MDKARLLLEDATLNIGVLASLIGLHYVANMANEALYRTMPGKIRGSVIGGTLSFAQQSAYKMFAHTPSNVIR